MISVPISLFELPEQQSGLMVDRNFVVITVAVAIRCWKYAIVVFVDPVITAVIDSN